MVRKGKAKIGFKSAIKIIGPDCAFHLYAHKNEEKNEPGLMPHDPTH